MTVPKTVCVCLCLSVRIRPLSIIVMLHARWLVSARVIGGRAPDVTDSTMTASTSKHFIKINDRGDELRRQKCALTRWPRRREKTEG